MFFVLKLLFSLWVLCAFVSALVAQHSTISSSSSTNSAFHGAAQSLEATPRQHGHATTMLGRAGAASAASISSRSQFRSSLKKAGGPLHALVLSDNYGISELDTMRHVYGPRRKWWGDLDARQTRAFYHELLPIALLVQEDESLTLQERARRASMARHAARLYARERCALPERVTAALWDGFRHLQTHGTWNAHGVTWEELWQKYERQVRRELGSGADEDAVRDAVCLRILQKSCSTNKAFDKMTGAIATAAITAAVPASADAARHVKHDAPLRAVNVVFRRKVARARRAVARVPLAELAGRTPVGRRRSLSTMQRA